MKIVIIGANGQLGTDLCKVLDKRDYIALTDKDIDITDFDNSKKVITSARPDVIINTAAFVRVDDCESVPDIAFSVNALGARNMAVIAQNLNARLVHLGSDYIFGGDEKRTIPYTEFDHPDPINVYGKSKLEGENYVRHLCTRNIIIRTSSLFGKAGSLGKGGNFVETMLKLGKERPEIKVVNDQIVSPTYALDLAEKIKELIQTEYYGIFHITNSGTCSWYEFTSEIVAQAGLKTRVIPITSDQYPQPARRPKYSVLNNYQLKLLRIGTMRSWQEALSSYLQNR